MLIDAPRASGALMNEATGEDLSLGGPTGLFSKALRASVKRISVASLKGMGLRDDRFVFLFFFYRDFEYYTISLSLTHTHGQHLLSFVCRPVSPL